MDHVSKTPPKVAALGESSTTQNMTEQIKSKMQSPSPRDRNRFSALQGTPLGALAPTFLYLFFPYKVGPRASIRTDFGAQPGCLNHNFGGTTSSLAGTITAVHSAELQFHARVFKNFEECVVALIRICIKPWQALESTVPPTHRSTGHCARHAYQLNNVTVAPASEPEFE